MKPVITTAAAMLLLAFAGAGIAENDSVLVPDEITYQMAIQAFGVSEQAARAAATLAAEEAVPPAGAGSYWFSADQGAGVILTDNPYGVK